MSYEKATELFGLKKRQQEKAQARQAALAELKSGYEAMKGTLEKPLSDFYNLVVKCAKATKLPVEMEDDCTSFPEFVNSFLYAALAKGARGNGHLCILSINPGKFDSILDLDSDEDDSARWQDANKRWREMLSKTVIEPVKKAVAASSILSKLIKVEFDTNPDDDFFQADILVTAAAFEMLTSHTNGSAVEAYIGMRAPAMELFGSKARAQQRQARRMVTNEVASKVMQVYLKQYKAKLGPAMERVIEEANKITEIRFKDYKVNAKRPNYLRVLDGLIDHGYLGGRESIIGLCYDEFHLPNGKTLYDSSDGADWEAVEKNIDVIEKEVQALVKSLNAVAPIFDVDLEMDDDGLYVYLTMKQTAESFFLKQFTSFDSFMAMEGMITEDAKDGLKALTAIGVGGVFALGFGLTSRYIMAALSIGGVALYVSSCGHSIARRHAKNADWKNQTPEEQASVEVFKKKYEPAMLAEAENLRRMMMAKLGSVVGENGIPLQAVSPTYLHTNHIYSHFFMASAKIPVIKSNLYHANRVAIRDWEPFIDDFMMEIDRKYNGILGCSYVITAKEEIVYGITFEWVGHDGIILPNLR